MNRCTRHLFGNSFGNLRFKVPGSLPSTLLLAAVCALGTAATAVNAQTYNPTPTVRVFPAAAMRGELITQSHPQITLNGKPEQLSPGARIFDKNNQMVMTGALANQKLVVNYLRDGGGQIHQVWILNSEEIKEKRAGSNITLFNLIFGDAPAKN